MKIQSIAVKIPSRKLTNQDILDLLTTHSNGVSKRTLTAYRRIVKGLLEMTGSEIRYIRNKEKNEKASDLVAEAMKEALKKTALDKDEIDLLIYCGVGKGFLEPANAYFYARAMGMGCSCFDITDACMSWIRALEIAFQFLKGDRYKNIMIVNGEFNAYCGLPANFAVKSLKQLEYTFPTYTIGEAATATIVTASNAEWSFRFKTMAELCDLCSIPLEGFENYVEPSERLAKNGVYNFVAYGKEMFASAEKYLGDLLKESVKDLDEPDIYFPHAASSAAYLTGARKIGIKPEKMYSKVFPSYGNIVSASIPAGIDLALQERRLKRGDKVVLCPASAGMVYSVVQFVY